MSIWYLLKPSFKKYWMGQLWYIGTNGFSLIIDFRGINTFEDFADALKYPKTWNILKKLKKHFKLKEQ
jgi:hypothetical protein